MWTWGRSIGAWSSPSAAVASPLRASRTRPGLCLPRGFASGRVKAVPSGSSTSRPRERLGRSKQTHAGWVWSLSCFETLRSQPGLGPRGGQCAGRSMGRALSGELSEAGYGELQAPPAPGCARIGGSLTLTLLFPSPLPPASYRACELLKGRAYFTCKPVNLSGPPDFLVPALCRSWQIQG